MGKRGPQPRRVTERIIDDLKYHPEFTNDLMPIRWGCSREYIRQICQDYLGMSLMERRRRIRAGTPIWPNMEKRGKRYAKYDINNFITLNDKQE